MNRYELEKLWRAVLASPSEARFDEVARSVVEVYASDTRFREHIQNRSKRVTTRTGVSFDPDNFDEASARAFIADEIGFSSWRELIEAVKRPDEKSILFRYAIAALERGDFTALEEAIGAERFYDQIVEWCEGGMFDGEQETLDEILSASCMLGQTKTAAYLLDRGVDPYAGMKTWLAGPHYAVSSGRLETVKMLIEKKVPLEVENKYGGTMLGQALWSAINEHSDDHAEIIETLIGAGAEVEPGTLKWWEAQNVPSGETKHRVAEVLRRHDEFHERVHDAENKVAEAEAGGAKRALADALKQLGNILRRPPFTRDAANDVYQRAADLYLEVGLPLEAAWVKRHIGINHEYGNRLEEAEKYYDEALALYREHSKQDDLNYANAVRYPAVVKNRLGKRDESAALWEEAHDRYGKVHPDGLGEGVAETAAWLTIFAIEKDDRDLALKWFARAQGASSRSQDPDTHKFIDEVRRRLEEKYGTS